MGTNTTSLRARFGRHQTFPMRFSWPTKGFRYWCEGHNIYDHTEPGVALGVGKNMVNSIKYWLQACGLIEEKSDLSVSPSEIGALLLSPSSGQDPYLEDDVSLWLLHWNIASNQYQATTFYWFFNFFHKVDFKPNEVLASLKTFLSEKTTYTVATKTLESDVAVLLRMYAVDSSMKGPLPPEDSLLSPMTQLNLIDMDSEESKFRIRNIDRTDLPVEAFGYSLLDVLEITRKNNISIGELLKSQDETAAPGAVFKLSEDGLVVKVEELVKAYPQLFDIRETAGIHQVYRLNEISKIDFMKSYFQSRQANMGVQ